MHCTQPLFDYPQQTHTSSNFLYVALAILTAFQNTILKTITRKPRHFRTVLLHHKLNIELFDYCTDRTTHLIQTSLQQILEPTPAHTKLKNA